jgi:hypothetical protein
MLASGRGLQEVISDRDTWAAALLMTKRYGADAAQKAAIRADQLPEEGGWRHIRRRCAVLSDSAPDWPPDH